MSTEVKIRRPRPCDLCAEVQRNNPDILVNIAVATVDGRTTFGPWANMCDEHWKSHGIGKLGTGYGQRLIVEEQ